VARDAVVEALMVGDRSGLAVLVCIALTMVVPRGARAQFEGPFAWTISGSDTDEFDNAIDFVPGLQTHYLWLACCSPFEGSGFGCSAAEFDLASTNPANVILTFTPTNGFLNAGGATNLLLVVAGCPCGPVVAGNILVQVSEPGGLCLVPSAGGIMGTAACEPDPIIYSLDWQGLDFGGGSCGDGEPCVWLDLFGACCQPDGSCEEVRNYRCEGEFHNAFLCEHANCPPTAAEATSWGRTKCLYR
jgi:hypothetical protein